MKYIIAAMIPVGIITGLYLYHMMKRALVAFGFDFSQKPIKVTVITISVILGIVACFFRTIGALALYYIDRTTAIVTSGFYGWSWPVKSGVPSEYVIINISELHQ